MEDSAFEAIYTGVYIFIFIAALTMTLYMFRNVNELAERSYEYGMLASDDSLIESPEETEKILNKSDVISYYYNYINLDNYGSDKPDTLYEVNFSADEQLEYSDLLRNLTKTEYFIEVDEGKEKFKISYSTE